MSIKINLVTKTSPNYNENAKEIKTLNKTILEIQGVNHTLATFDGPMKERMSLTSESLDTAIKEARFRRNKLLEKQNKKRMFAVKADRTWDIYEEFIDEESGRTLYGNPGKYIVKDDRMVRYSGGPTYKLEIDTTINLDPNTKINDQMKQIHEKVLAPLRAYRKQRQAIGYVDKEYHVPGLPYNASYRVYAGGAYGMGNNKFTIHMEPGEIMKLKEATKLRKVFDVKTPLTSAHHVGVEIEFICKSDKFKLAQFLAAEKLEEFVTLKDDGSLRPEDSHPYAHELCVLAPQPLIHEVLRRVCSALEKAGSKVNGRCGLHVHLDMRNRNKNVVFNNLVKSQDVLYSMNPLSRLDGTRADGKKDTAYSKKMKSADFDEVLAEVADSPDKYWGINPKTFRTLQTLEVRLHSGSTNYRKLSNWVSILCAIADCTEMHSRAVNKPETFAERFGLDAAMVEYIKERVNKFKDGSGKHVTIDEIA